MHRRNLLETVLEQALFKIALAVGAFYLGLVASLAMLLAALPPIDPCVPTPCG